MNLNASNLIGSGAPQTSAVTTPPTIYPNRTSRVWKGTIAPGKTSGPIPFAGNIWYILATDENLAIKNDNGAFKVGFEKGMGEVVPSDSLFSLIEIRNDGDADATVRVYLGFGTIIDNRLIASSQSAITVVDGESSLLQGFSGTMATEDLVTFSGAVPSDDYLRRKSIIIQADEDNTEPVEIWDVNDDVCFFVNPASSVSFETSGYVAVKNNTGSSQVVTVCEVWYNALG